MTLNDDERKILQEMEESYYMDDADQRPDPFRRIGYVMGTIIAVLLFLLLAALLVAAISLVTTWW